MGVQEVRRRSEYDREPCGRDYGIALRSFVRLLKRELWDVISEDTIWKMVSELRLRRLREGCSGDSTVHLREASEDVVWTLIMISDGQVVQGVLYSCTEKEQIFLVGVRPTSYCGRGDQVRSGTTDHGPGSY